MLRTPSGSNTGCLPSKRCVAVSWSRKQTGEARSPQFSPPVRPRTGVTRPKVTSGKRQRQEQKRSKALAKAERRTERRAADPTPSEPVAGAEESQLVEELAELHRALEEGTLGQSEFEEQRERVRTLLERLH